MPYIGNTPADKFLTLAKQSFSTSATTSYTLDSAVSSTQDIALFINNVRQSPVDAYSVSGTSLTLTSATAGTDEMYCVYLGKTVGTVSPASNSVTTAMIQSNAVNNAKMADDAIGLAELSATGTPSSSNFLRGDNAWASAGGNNTPYFLAERTSPEQQISDNTVTKIEFQTEILDSGTVYDPSTNYRFTVPSGEAGRYYIFAGAGLSGDANSEFLDGSLYIYKNGSEDVSAHVNSATNYPRTLNFQIAHIFNLSESDYIEIYGYVNRNSAGNARVQHSNNTYFGGFKLI